MKNILYTFVLVAAVLFVSWASFMMLGTWTMVKDASEFVYHYGSGIGTFLLGFAAIYAIFFGMNKYERAMVAVEERKLDIEEQKQNLKRKDDAYELMKVVLPDFDFAIRNIMSSIEAEFYNGEIEETYTAYPQSEGLGSTEILGFVVLKRLKKAAKYRERLMEKQPLFKVIFGTEEPFERFQSLYRKIHAHGNELAMYPRKESTWQRLVPYLMDDKDEISNELKEIRELLHSYSVEAYKLDEDDE